VNELTAADFEWAAWYLDCDVPAIKAIAAVESPRGPFDEMGRPSILFERHIFHRLTSGRWSSEHPDISNPRPGGYGRYREQHDRLGQAAALDRIAALKSASWGAFQLMGFNHVFAGYETVQGFVNAMYRSATDQLRAFLRFVQSSPGIVTALRQHDWPEVARLYNGPAYARNRYDQRLEAHYLAAKK